ncbi:MAG: hypothetical protein AAFQ82_20180, partial [Myxococcota bacterium]
MTGWREIEQGWSADPVLRGFGAALCVGLALGALWFLDRDAHLWLHPDREALCWPGSIGCASFRILPAEGWRVLFVLLLLASVATAAGFLRGKRWAWWTLIGVSILQYTVLIQTEPKVRKHH